MTFARETLGQHLNFANGKTSPQRTELGRYAVFGSNGEIGRSDEKNSSAQTTVIGRVGSYCGSVHYSPEPCWVTDNAIKATAKTPEEGRFWFFALANQNLHDLRAGSGQPLINQTSLKAVELPVPGTDDRQKIGALLGALDDKIELNRRMNETLEEMARALFRDWFVDFGPTRRQADGVIDPAAIMGHAFPPEKAAAIAPLFPSSLGDDGLPQGWEMRQVSYFGKFKGGKQLPKAEFVEGGPFPVFGGAGHMGQTDKFNAEEYVITVGRVGAYCGNFVSHRGKAWVNNNASVFQLANWAQPEWIFLALRELDLEPIKKGAAQPFVSNGEINELPLIEPGAEVRQATNDLLAAFLLKLEANERENQTLAEMRDLLLPKLMSGEIRLSNVEAGR
ncbi:MAG: restriction endonuclease subunit S [Shimia sp.]|uniref:restriction endonuclease subunit S n=1 Tax=Shimia sp. TaxID=1954381 RepID=UPI001AFFB12D|nr:restriction endonuclease subunit S [Shimia sp.]MBO6899115.1 restriction endonuclease subunit S [Shimia sp.]